MNGFFTRRFPIAVSVGIACVVFASRADAQDEKVACAQAAEAAQSLKLDGKLVEAREKAAFCARDACPSVVRDDCRPWLREIDESVPTLVVAAKDGRGRDLLEVSLLIDGVVVASRLSGTPIPINPGEHTIELEGAGYKQREKIIVRAAEKNRTLSIVLGPRVAEVTPPAGPVTTTKSAVNPAAWVFAGTTVAAIGAFAVLSLTARADARDLRERCAPRCNDSDVSDVRTRLIVGDVFLGLGALSAGLATWLFLNPTISTVQIAPTSTGLSLGWSRSFQ